VPGAIRIRQVPSDGLWQPELFVQLPAREPDRHLPWNSAASSVVGDASNSFCVDPTHIAPLAQYYTDLTNGTLPSFAFIEAGYQ